MGNKEKRVCLFCGRMAARAFRFNVTRVSYRHKCPHGEWCKGGNRLRAQHSNWPDCKDCMTARMREEEEHQAEMRSVMRECCLRVG